MFNFQYYIPLRFQIVGVMPNGALILENGFDYKVNPKSHLKATVGIYQKL